MFVGPANSHTCLLSPLDHAKIYGSDDTEYPYGKSVFRRIEIIADPDNKRLGSLVNRQGLTIAPPTSEDLDEIIGY